MVEVIGEITKIKKETYDVKTLRLNLTENIDFIPGQYCLVSMIGKEEFKGESKPFTFSSSPTQKGYIELTIKKIGKFTTAIHSLKIGDKLKIEGSFGESLNFDESIKDNIVFLAGGSGITPFISSIRYAIAKHLPNNIILFFSNRTEKDIIYKKELGEINKDENIKVINTLSSDVSDSWSGEKGRIDKEMIEKYVKNPKEKLWYICGPPPMVDSMKEILIKMNVSIERLRIEDWQVPGKHD